MSLGSKGGVEGATDTPNISTDTPRIDSGTRFHLNIS